MDIIDVAIEENSRTFEFECAVQSSYTRAARHT
jgi:hypothetical protein